MVTRKTTTTPVKPSMNELGYDLSKLTPTALQTLITEATKAKNALDQAEKQRLEDLEEAEQEAKYKSALVVIDAAKKKIKDAIREIENAVDGVDSAKHYISASIDLGNVQADYSNHNTYWTSFFY